MMLTWPLHSLCLCVMQYAGIVRVVHRTSRCWVLTSLRICGYAICVKM